VTWDGRDVWRDEDGPRWTDNDDHDRILYPHAYQPHDPRLPTPEGGGGFSFPDVPACPRCRYLHKPEDGCECKSAGCLGRTDEDGFCSRCGKTAPFERAAHVAAGEAA
jgi:hypothetical protein